MPVTRYAVYFVPAADTALYRAGAALIGYDVYGGGRRPFPPGLPCDDGVWSALTAAPRVYGFHATLKAPFRLAPGTGAAELAAAVASFAGAWREGVTITPSLAAVDGRFAALVPDRPCPTLDRLAAACVRAFEAFRAPLSEAERRRRMAAPLTARQRHHLERWGYPHVFEDFRFHMTLTGPLAAPRHHAVLAGLRTGLSAVAGVPVSVDRIALVHQSDPDSRFRVIASAPLAGVI
jgi:putative phosphonate metabolism protein